jgi:hypothetical protein
MRFLILKLGENNEEDKTDAVNDFADSCAELIAKYFRDRGLTEVDILPVLTLLEARCKQKCLETIDEIIEEEKGSGQDRENRLN